MEQFIDIVEPELNLPLTLETIKCMAAKRAGVLLHSIYRKQ